LTDELLAFCSLSFKIADNPLPKTLFLYAFAKLI